VAAARGEGEGPEAEDRWSPQITVGTAVLIPESYIADLSVRLDLYRRVAALEELGEIDAFAAEMIDRFGPLPREVEHLLEIVIIKSYCRQAGVGRLEAGPRGATLTFRDNRYANPAGLVEFISQNAGSARLRPDHTLLYLRDWSDDETRLKGARYLTRNLAEIAAQASVDAAAPAAASASEAP
jgi:transcription-repair coupling factor (superfamily II helicase)